MVNLVNNLSDSVKIRFLGRELILGAKYIVRLYGQAQEATFVGIGKGLFDTDLAQFIPDGCSTFNIYNLSDILSEAIADHTISENEQLSVSSNQLTNDSVYLSDSLKIRFLGRELTLGATYIVNRFGKLKRGIFVGLGNSAAIFEDAIGFGSQLKIYDPADILM